MQTVVYKGQPVEASDACAAIIRRQAARDAAPRTILTVPAVAAVQGAKPSPAPIAAGQAAHPSPAAAGLFTREGREAAHAQLRAQNAAHRAFWAAREG